MADEGKGKVGVCEIIIFFGGAEGEAAEALLVQINGGVVCQWLLALVIGGDPPCTEAVSV